MTSVVTAEDLSYSYPTGERVLEGIDFSAARGERIAILGPNGSGKSTLLQLLGGLLEPDGGTVRYFDGKTDAETLRDRFSVVLQEPEDYLFNASIREDLRYGPSQMGLSESSIEDTVSSLAEALDLEALLERPPFRLSGGEKRRAALAAGLSTDPELIFLDEPFSDIDANYRRQAMDLLAEQNETGMTQVIATSNTDIVPKIADRVCLLDGDGGFVSLGPPREALSAVDVLRAAGLSPPCVVELFADAELSDPPVTIEEARTWVDKNR